MVGGYLGDRLADLLKDDTPMGRSIRSGVHLAHHFAEVPLLLIGFGRNSEGSGIYPALWSAMLAARAEGLGSTMTGMLQSFFANEIFTILDVPPDAGWYLHGVIPMGYPLGKWRIAVRKPVHEVAARNTWQGDLGFKATEPLWSK
jgi:nitroreductase